MVGVFCVEHIEGCLDLSISVILKDNNYLLVSKIAHWRDKKRAKELKEEKYTQATSEWAAGMTKEKLPPAHAK